MRPMPDSNRLDLIGRCIAYVRHKECKDCLGFRRSGTAGKALHYTVLFRILDSNQTDQFRM